jgi:hypothetical protein
MVKLENTGKSLHGTAFAIKRDGEKVGTAYRIESGKHRGLYTFGTGSDTFTGSRARLIAHVEAL